MRYSVTDGILLTDPVSSFFDGDLILAGTEVSSLGTITSVRGTLDATGCLQLRSLPEGLEVEMDLILKGSAVENLPAGLKVKCDLNIEDTSIMGIPACAQIGCCLYLSNTVVETLPDGLDFRGFIYGAPQGFHARNFYSRPVLPRYGS